MLQLVLGGLCHFYELIFSGTLSRGFPEISKQLVKNSTVIFYLENSKKC